MNVRPTEPTTEETAHRIDVDSMANVVGRRAGPAALGARTPARRPTLRVAAVAALILTVGLGAISTVLFLAAFQFRLDWFADPAQVVAGGTTSAALFKWAALTDLFSFYLPTAVVALALWVALKHRGPMLATAALAGALGYVLVGGVGAAALAMAGAPLMVDYAEPGADQAAIATTFATLINVVFRAVWQLVDGILLSIWMVATGLLIWNDHPGLGRLSLGLGVLLALGTGLNVLGLGLLRDISLGLVFITWAGWSIWLAVLIWRRRPPFDALDAPHPSSGGRS
ncbi:hypothetical protein BH20CHL7_BH20CHL7_02930 [soil metagenome]